MASPKSKSGSNAVAKPSSECSQVIAVWLDRYAAMYREETTDPLAAAYQEGLKGLGEPWLLDAAFRRAMRASRFRPTVQEVIEAYALEAEDRHPFPALEEPKLSLEERQKVADEARKVLVMGNEPFRNPDGSHTEKCLCQRCRWERARR